MAAKTIEQEVAETILQKQEEVFVGEKKYKVAPPSVATLILVSEAIARMPQIKTNNHNIVIDSLHIAKDCKPLGEIAAILLLGAKNITETKKSRQTVKKRRLCGLVRWTEEVEVERIIDRKAELAKQILENYTPRALNRLITDLLRKMELGDFFGLTTFLIGVNMLRPTKVENETTASGQ